MSEQTLVVGDQRQLPGELLYEYTPKITHVVEYGASADALIQARRGHQPRGRASTSISKGLSPGS